MGKVYTRFQTKTAQKPHPITIDGAAHTCIAYIREYHPGIFLDTTSERGVNESVLYFR